MMEGGRAGYILKVLLARGHCLKTRFEKASMRVLRVFDPWKSPLCTCPFKYSLHPYTGCSHFCLYCYATSYIGRKPSVPKNRFLDALKTDLLKVKQGSIIELSTSSDPYPPIEEWVELTRNTLTLLLEHGMRVLITTKSYLVRRDVDILSKTPSAVMITITTLNRGVSRILEPDAPSPEDRLEAIRYLKDHGIPVGARIDPVIPGVNDDPLELKDLVDAIVDAGAQHIVTSTYKARGDSLKRLSQAFKDKSLASLYKEKGEIVHGSIYLPKNERARLLQPVISRAVERGITVATCREGLGAAFFKAPSCDGSHMIALRKKRVNSIESAGENSGA